MRVSEGMGADEMISKDASTQEILAAIRTLLRGKNRAPRCS